MADNFYSKYSANEPASVVTSLNSLINAVTLAAGSGISITPSGQTLTIAATGGGTVTSVATGTGLTGGPITTTGTISLANTAVTPGSYTNSSITVDQQGRLTSASSGAAGANVTLSNLTSPTAVNQDLIMAAGKTVRIPNNTALFIRNAADSANISVLKVDTSDNIILGESTGFNIKVATANFFPANSGANLGAGVQSWANIYVDGFQTSIIFKANVGTIKTQDGTSSDPISLSTGDASAGNSSDLEIKTGTATGTRGKIILKDGSEGTTGYVWTSTDANGRGNWAAAAGSATNNKETFVLSGTDITNQYVDLAFVARTNSINFMVKGSGDLLEGASYDYSVSYTGGAGGNTRITFLNDLATGGGAALIATDVVQVQYEH